MSSVSLRRVPQRNRIRNVWGEVTRVAAVTLLCCAPRAAFAQAEADFEKPPVLEAKDLVPEKLLTGKGVRTEDKVPTDGVMGTFIIHADKGTQL